MATSEFYKEIVAANGVFKTFINSEWVESASGNSVAIVNPTSNQKEFYVQACTQAEVDTMFESAKAAQKAWSRVPLYKRAEYLHAVAKIMRENAKPMVRTLYMHIVTHCDDSYLLNHRSISLVESPIRMIQTPIDTDTDTVTTHAHRPSGWSRRSPSPQRTPWLR